MPSERERELVVARERRGADHGVVDRVGHRGRVVEIDEELGGDVGRVEHRLVLSACPVEPPEVAEGEGLRRPDDLGADRDVGGEDGGRRWRRSGSWESRLSAGQKRERGEVESKETREDTGMANGHL